MATYNSFKRIATDSIINNSVAAADIANNAAQAGKFVNSAVTSAKIGNLAVGATQLAASVDLSTKTVTYRTVVDGDISASAAIAGTKLASGAATTNLGYTPLNQAGGTMTGSLAVVAGSAGSAGIALSGQTNTGIFTDSGNNIAFTVAGTTRMRFNANGHRTVGNSSTDGSVMWQAAPTTGWTYANSYGGFGWREIGGGAGWDSYQRGGSNFSNSNGRFTAPVSGFYSLNWQSYGYNDDNNTPNYLHMSFSRSGDINPYSGRNPHGIWMHGTVANHANGMSLDLDLYLNQGEYTSMFFYWAGGPSRNHGNHSIFNGYLIG
jgi:hypothetical protein